MSPGELSPFNCRAIKCRPMKCHIIFVISGRGKPVTGKIPGIPPYNYHPGDIIFTVDDDDIDGEDDATHMADDIR